MTKIKSLSLYPNTHKRYGNDLPEGCALASRIGDWSGARPVSEPWPAVPIGEQIEIETDSHWIWHGTLEQVRDGDHWVVRIKDFPCGRLCLPW